MRNIHSITISFCISRLRTMNLQLDLSQHTHFSGTLPERRYCRHCLYSMYSDRVDTKRTCLSCFLPRSDPFLGADQVLKTRSFPRPIIIIIINVRDFPFAGLSRPSQPWELTTFLENLVMSVSEYADGKSFNTAPGMPYSQANQWVKATRGSVAAG